MIVAYLRVSTSKQHLQNQKEEIKRYALKDNLIVDDWVSEVVSGKTNQRSRRLGKLIERLQKGDTLIITEISRLSRSLHDLMYIMSDCITRNVTIRSTKEGYIFDDSINSTVLSFAFGLAAEIEHTLISQRTKEALCCRKAQGKPVGRQTGTNYKYQKVWARKAEIMGAVQSGMSINKTCRYFQFSYTLFERLRKDFPELDDFLNERKKEKRKKKTRSVNDKEYPRYDEEYQSRATT